MNHQISHMIQMSTDKIHYSCFLHINLVVTIKMLYESIGMFCCYSIGWRLRSITNQNRSKNVKQNKILKWKLERA